MTKRQREFFEKRFKQLYVEGWDRLQVKLKEHGGEMLVPVDQSPDMVRLLLERGHGFDSAAVVHRPGEASQCHKNALKAWGEDESVQVVMGYGLSEDGLWRQHSWLWDPVNNQIIETTVPRVKYFGVVLTDIQAFTVFQQCVHATIYDKAADRFFKCAQQIKERSENEGIEWLLPELNAFVAWSPADEQSSPKSLQNTPEFSTLDKIAAYKSGGADPQAPGEPPAIQRAQGDVNLSYEERSAIFKRWIWALNSAEIAADVTTGKQKLTLNASSYPKEIKIKCIGASIHLTNLGRSFGSPESTPFVLVFVHHNRGIIEVDGEFATAISAAVSKDLGKPVQVKSLAQDISQEPNRLMMECADSQSAWILADHILRENGYGEPPRCSHEGGTCAVCGDLLTEPNGL